MFIAFRPTPIPAVGSPNETTTSAVASNEADKMAAVLVPLYNKKNTAALYDQFDSLAKIQITKEQMTAQMGKLSTLIGRIDSYAYSHTTMAGTQGGRTFYTLHYKVRLSEGQLPTGDMTLTVTRNAGGLSLFGFFINGTTNQQGQ